MWARCESLEIDRTGWSVQSVDTEETNGEGPNNGRAPHTIDNNNSTFWHTRWQNYTAEFPHFISIDMGAVYPINGISIRSRQDNSYNKAKGYELYLSLDGETWGTGGWELELKLHYYQGMPEYRYSEIEEVWHGTYNFGDLSDLQPVPQATIDAPLSTEEASFRVVTTGHGWGANNTGNAAEFYYANHNFNVNEVNTFDQSMRVTCNPNPDGCTGQMGTWYHARAGWCPGAIAKPYLYDLTPHIGESFAFDYEFELGYVDYCHPNNPQCISGVTCADCNDGYNPHYRIGAYAVYKSNNPLGVLSTKEVQPVIDNKLIVLPNPSNGIFKVYLENEMQKLNLQIYDTNGAAIKRYTFNNAAELNSYTFNVEDLTSGVYFIKVYNEKQMAATKFIIK